MKRVDLIVSIIGLVGLITLSISAMIDSHATDIVSGVIVQFIICFTIYCWICFLFK